MIQRLKKNIYSSAYTTGASIVSPSSVKHLVAYGQNPSQRKFFVLSGSILFSYTPFIVRAFSTISANVVSISASLNGFTCGLSFFSFDILLDTYITAPYFASIS